MQCRVDPLRHACVISTHDQLLGGPSGQIYLGCTFPADTAYSTAVHDAGIRVAHQLACDGVIGRFGVDFVSVRNGDSWTTTAIEINLRKGGTTHPFLMLQYLTDGLYDAPTTTYRTATQQGVVFHLIGALSEFGKLGTVCIGDSRESAERFFHDTVAVLNRETRRRR